MTLVERVLNSFGMPLRQLMESGNHLESITPFDLFPQTYHIESISILSK